MLQNAAWHQVQGKAVGCSASMDNHPKQTTRTHLCECVGPCAHHDLVQLQGHTAGQRCCCSGVGTTIVACQGDGGCRALGCAGKREGQVAQLQGPSVGGSDGVGDHIICRAYTHMETA
jgi:hypothetical protein